MYHFDYRAKFIISDKNLDLGNYATLLTGFPFEEIKKGKELYDKSGNKLNRKAYLSSLLQWRLHPEDEVSSEQKPLSEIVFECIRQIEGQKSLFQELRGLDAGIRIEVALHRPFSYSVFTLSPKLTEQLSANGIELNLCFVVPPGRLC